MGKLNFLGNRYISIGGRIILLIVVLNLVPIFNLLFMNMPTSVWKKIVNFQR